MSVVVQTKRVTVPEIVSHKNAKPVVCLTCYHAHTARLLDEHVDLMLVGDSVGMVMHGMETTLGVTLDMMILHGQAVMRGSKHALIVVDMPFGSYEESPAGGVPQCRPRGPRNRLPSGEVGRRRAHGRDRALHDPARHSGDGPYRAHPPAHSDFRRLQELRAARQPNGLPSRPMPVPWPKPGRSR